jgi:hypothetical protein
MNIAKRWKNYAEGIWYGYMLIDMSKNEVILASSARVSICTFANMHFFYVYHNL